MTPELLQQLVLVLVPLILSLTIHEGAHAAAAWWLGDDTAARQGRFTLNPISHIDPIGSLLLPAVLVFSGSGLLFGWAKPVPFNPVKFTRSIGGQRIRMKHGILFTAAAGPLSNLLLAVLCAFLWGVLPRTEASDQFLQMSVFLNVMLFIFNLLPVPPLDGSKVVYGLLPDRSHGILQALEKHRWLAPAAFLAVFLFGGKYIGPPIFWLSGKLFEVFA